jgi:hypothetical protein
MKLGYKDELHPKLPRRLRGLPARQLLTKDEPHPTRQLGAVATRSKPASS